MRLFRSWIWLLLLLLPVIGCKGCTQSPDPNAAVDPKEEEARRKKQRLVADELRTMPFATEIVGNMVKPGHWYQIRNKLKANFGDESLTASLAVTDREGNPLPNVWSDSSLEFKRNVSLAVGQEKAIDVLVLHPDVAPQRDDEFDQEKKTSSIRTRFTLRGLGTPILEETFPNKFLEGYQYDMVILSRDLSRHTFWRGLDCVVWRRTDDLQANRFVPYHIIDVTEEELATHFPSRLATMTCMSHIVLNDASLSVLGEDQQSALLDWLHFGGTIIVNGPEAVSTIESSILKPWVPLVSTSEGEWTQESQSEFDRNWSIRIAGGERVPFRPDRKIPILSGTLAPDAQWVPMLEGLVAERLIGQGRIVMTTFPMADAAFLRWPSYSSLIHNGILRKPHRTPSVGDEAKTMYAEPYEGTERNPVHNTRLRIWARDFDLSLIRTDSEVLNTQSIDGAAKFPAAKTTSLGAWNPSSRVLEHATNCLRESSGIKVPQISTIMKLLIGYLVVLVPLNWLLFRLIGRVEWAWIAAPILSLVGAIVVAKSVQLDVGFSRSQTSYGFLECHNGYNRAVLSNFNALYTSLSTNYEAVYRNGDGIVLPVPRASTRKGLGDNESIDYWVADERGSGLQRFPVLSNTTGLLQSEETLAMAGPIQWAMDTERRSVSATNDSELAIKDVGLIGLDKDGRLIKGWVGSLEPGATSEASWSYPTEDDRWLSDWDANPILKKPDVIRASDGRLWTDQSLDDVYLGALLMVIAQRYPLQHGECIALGWTDKNPSRLEISPTTVQQKHKTLVLMHVRSESLGEVQPDSRIFASINDSETE